MKVTYDPEVDVLRIRFSDRKVLESDEEKPGVILDYDQDGAIVGLEILQASKQVENPGPWSSRSRVEEGHVPGFGHYSRSV
jgi:uncharacterized protein YuzE